MREAFQGLTTRGKCLISIGIAMALLSFLLGEKDLLRVAVLIAVVPLASVALLARTRYRISSVRQVDPIRVEAGHEARVTLQLRNLSKLPTGTLMLEDRLPYALGNRPRLVLERMHGNGGSSVTYSVKAEHRGRYNIGPLVTRLTDPFGLIEVTRAYPSTDHLTVTPPIIRLPAIRLPGEYAGSGDNRSRAVAVHGEDDVATREYRYGDDLRRVHWRSTARTGELMVRREEQPWDSRATVLMDVRAAGHRGDGPASSFEWSVTATASIATHLRLSGYRLRVVTEHTDLEPDAADDGLVMDYLAGVQPRRRGELTRLIDQVRRRDHGGLIVAVMGSMSAEEAGRLAGLRTSGATCIGLLMDTTTWLNLPDKVRAEADRAYQQSMAVLLRSGWRVVPIRSGDDLSHQWRGLTTGSDGFSYRGTMAATGQEGR